ncbi:FGGY family carbohydrate kinase, partial [Kribbella sp. NPDC050820]|uniref:xylulokinase n=1 Tax=Kribbella sp. NPDC050820 TaxID=3155408 RepID=UPI003401BF4A
SERTSERRECTKGWSSVTGALLLGVDIGTQSAKAALFDSGGTCLAASSAPLTLHRRGPAAVEQEPEDFYRATIKTIAACVAKAGCAPGEVAAIGLSGQMAGILGIGADGRAVTPYDSWLDSRCRPEVDELARLLGDELVELTGCPPMVAHAPKLLWWRRTHPDVYASVAKFLVPSAFVAGLLCGLAAEEAYVDWTHLHFSGLADAANATWSPELTAEAGIDAGKLPRIVAPTERVGELTAEAAEACGLRAGTPVAAGLGDTAAGMLGAGIVRAGQVLDTAGTASVLGISTTAFRPDVTTRTLVQMRGALPGQWISLAYLAGGDVVRWLPSALGAGSLEELLGEAHAAAPARLLFVPYLGGRILPAAPSARGGWVGLDFSHTRGDLARAALESVAFEFAGFLERALELHPDLAPEDVRVIGGGSGDARWSLIKASALGLPYLRLRRESFACWGAALVAGAAAGLIDDVSAAAQAGEAEAERTVPDPSLQPVYRERLTDYRAVVDLLVPQHEEVVV